jgi:hypothetical protein
MERQPQTSVFKARFVDLWLLWIMLMLSREESEVVLVLQTRGVADGGVGLGPGCSLIRLIREQPPIMSNCSCWCHTAIWGRPLELFAGGGGHGGHHPVLCWRRG